MSATCRIDGHPACAWTPHGFKHVAAEGVTREDTRHGPARYLRAFHPNAIAALERETARRAEYRSGSVAGMTQYLREIGEVIGWDRGKDATLSYVQCVGNPHTRTLHGQPMSSDNPKGAKVRK